MVVEHPFAGVKPEAARVGAQLLEAIEVAAAIEIGLQAGPRGANSKIPLINPAIIRPPDVALQALNPKIKMIFPILPQYTTHTNNPSDKT